VISLTFSLNVGNRTTYRRAAANALSVSMCILQFEITLIIIHKVRDE
jgi:hypothetical protein